MTTLSDILKSKPFPYKGELHIPFGNLPNAEYARKNLPEGRSEPCPQHNENRDDGYCLVISVELT